MFLADYHTHTEYSIDGEGPLDAMCEKAIAEGLDELAITDHMDIISGQSCDYWLPMDKSYPAIRAAKERYAGRLRVVIGVELGEPMANPAAADEFFRRVPDLDFVIGSIHNMENDLDVFYYNWKKHDPAAAYRHYLEWLTDFAENYDYDVLGHLTYPLRYMAEAGITLDLKPYYDQFENLFRIVVRRDKGIELNVSGLRQAMKTTMPTPEILQLYHDCGGRILTIGSDAHRAADIGAHLTDGLDIARSCGFTEIASYTRRAPVFRSI